MYFQWRRDQAHAEKERMCVSSAGFAHICNSALILRQS